MTHDDAVSDARAIRRARPGVGAVIYYHSLSGRYVTKSEDAQPPTSAHWSRFSTVDTDGTETLEHPVVEEAPAPMDAEAFAASFAGWLKTQRPNLTVKELTDVVTMTATVKQFLAETPDAIAPAVLKAMTNV